MAEADDSFHERHRIVNVCLEEPEHIRLNPQVEHERHAALFDLIEDNHFKLHNGSEGPYVLHLGMEGERLSLDVRDVLDQPLDHLTIPLRALRRIIKDYFLVLDSYFKSIKTAAPSRIEAIDMGRRGLHDDGAELLRSRFADRVDMDKNTARRLFTLICVLHIRK